MDSAYWDIFPDTEDAEVMESDEGDEEVGEDINACSPDIKVPCENCRRKRRSSCKRCRERQRQLQVQHQSSPHTHPRRTRKSSLEIACFPDRSSSSYSSSSSSSNPSHPLHPSPPSPTIPTTKQDTIPEVILQQSPDDYSSPDTTTQKNTLTVPSGGPSFAAVYTNSPSWMSTYTSSTCATTYTTTHERSRRDGLGSGEKDVGDGWLDVRRRRRPPYPRRPRTIGRWDGEARSSMTAVTSSRMRSRWGEETVEGWDEGEMESGSYCVVEGARWEEQRFITSRRAAKAVVMGMGKSGARRQGRGDWRGVAGHGAKRRTRAVPLVDPPKPKVLFDLLTMRMKISTTGSMEGGRRGLLGLPFVEGRGHSRAVFAMAYVRGTAHVKGLWGLLSDRCDDTGGFLGFDANVGVWSVVLRYLGDILGFSRRERQGEVD
ncbi:uncharacterized protein BDZ83DRAFT_83955 [Colletotrichum acutatum]|uniref:Uncharacterized protein n=1 Tax=Glomerella acutata TaxID=27357 RepID=A0AAD8UDQ8_GLOAC|nr:uncharacterized protein BDZ83DRAFT_83955 [Colletotrichum acutatum]KAK1713362.1 hypothetical protein BDZ83DRAFT_83955 [Colletotrichum acutatum]